MRQLYLTFQKGGTVSHQLSQSHYYSILSIKNENKRNYYINISIKQNLSVRQLREKIKNNEYERLEYKCNIEITTDNKQITIKEFILEKIEEFLLELGYGFAFIGSEVKLGNSRCDLLFINYELNSFVVIELKIRKLKPIDIGQIKYYMGYIDEYLKKDYMNNTIGVILCKEGNEIVLKFCTDERIFMSTYKLLQ